MDQAWDERAACQDHPVLGPDAWGMVANGYPYGDGARALVVCRQACPVRAECRRHVTSGTETIAGGGWFDLKGTFWGGDVDSYDAHLAAAFLGVPVSKVRGWMNRRLPVKHVDRGRAWFDVRELLSVVHMRGVTHGTNEARSAHTLRGEKPCRSCAPVEENVFASV